MLRKFGVERQQAFRLVPQYCERLSADAVTQLLGNAAVDGVSIMVFVGSSGCIRIHAGIARSATFSPWMARMACADQCAGQRASTCTCAPT